MLLDCAQFGQAAALVRLGFRTIHQIRPAHSGTLSVLVLTVNQDADSIHGSGLISGMLTSDDGTVTYENDYVFGGTVAPGDPAELTVSFNSGCVWNTYHGHVTEGGDMVLVGTALGRSEDCSLTGDDSEGLMYFGRKHPPVRRRSTRLQPE